MNESQTRAKPKRKFTELPKGTWFVHKGTKIEKASKANVTKRDSRKENFAKQSGNTENNNYEKIVDCEAQERLCSLCVNMLDDVV